MKSWLTLVTSLPTENATVRQRVWRALKSSGAAVLRDGVYLLPLQPKHRTALEAIAREVRNNNGSAWVLQLKEPDEGDFEALFDRSNDYAALLNEAATLVARLAVKNAAATLKQAGKLQKTFAALADIDFFSGAARQQTGTSLQELAARCNRILMPDEPHAGKGRIPIRSLKHYQGKTWATRQRPWVDRLASAWLIQRFIDPAARFKWLQHPADCPAKAVGFDFDGASFTHIGNSVTFEVLMASFTLEQPALQRLAALVHYLDVGGVQPAEAAGLESILGGLRSQITDDDQLLAQSCGIFDGLYAAFSTTPASAKKPGAKK
jgi:hypothetical protein